MIDFGTMGYDYNEFTTGTAEYYNYFGRPMIPFEENTKFKSKEERLRGELFTVARTIQYCMIND